jgi:hypothetical protein
MRRLIREVFKGAAWSNPVLQGLVPNEPGHAEAAVRPVRGSRGGLDGAIARR